MTVPENPKREVIIPGSKANTWSFIVFIVTTLIAGGGFAAIYGFNLLRQGFMSFLTEYVVLAITLLVGAALHEFLHALAFSFASEKGWSSINFGFSFKDFAPYTHCNEAVTYVGFVIATLLPGIVLGILVLIISLISGDPWMLSFGIFFTAGAAGDFLCFAHLLKYQRQFRVKDHPDSIGFILIDPN